MNHQEIKHSQQQREKPQRTTYQNKSMHVLYADISKHCIAHGIDQECIVKVLDGYPVPVSPQFVKEVWRSMQIALTQKESTKDLTTDEVDEVYDVFNKFWSELTKNHFPFPSRESEALNRITDDDI